ncbi:hypothetical protein N7509_006236 [Penicillium cosmopolitanum]|uniref:Ankyrin repeat protein n=1 Tax=Penicillium cosmopolitanum TaxID=1131564 RepID=A0A9W9W3R5_9EURO|nr:uncharacterized protein N7509_006236 [Penicillium cosmopolitanum]KAJ5398123.1 hypothetical protein N7509_006236 [Penicillium cosmopolitanum]
MASSDSKPKPTVPIALPTESIDDLIYDARAGDLEALTADVASLASQHSCSEAQIVASAIDMEDESEGGTGSCVLHFPAANGNIEILSFLLQKLSAGGVAQRTTFINHTNHSGNTPLHWAALNTHLECVKALVEAGADVAIKNDAGHDAVFLAERAAWSASAEVVEENENGDQEIEMTIGGDEGEAQGEGEGQQSVGEMSAGRQVVEWLLSSEKSAGLESGAKEGESSA